MQPEKMQNYFLLLVFFSLYSSVKKSIPLLSTSFCFPPICQSRNLKKETFQRILLQSLALCHVLGFAQILRILILCCFCLICLLPITLGRDASLFLA